MRVCFGVIVIGLLCLLTISIPVYAELPSVVDYQPYVTFLRHQTGGGCGMYTTMQITDILKEMEFAYTPDLSLRFPDFVYNCRLHFGYCNITEGRPLDPRVPDGSTDQTIILQDFGSVPETDFPTNYDPYYPVMWNASYPKDWVFQEAQNYRLGPWFEDLYHPTVDQTREWLNDYGPLALSNMIPLTENPKDTPHVLTLLGYNDSTKQFKYLNQWGGGSPPNEGIGFIDYDTFADKSNNMSFNTRIRAFQNQKTPLIHPYVARINITHPHGRYNLIVKMGVEGKSQLIVWDQNNHLYYPYSPIDTLQQLTIDVPLPDYASTYWPPTNQYINSWYVEITNTEQGWTAKAATVHDITLVRRWVSPSTGLGNIDTYQFPITQPSQVLPGETVELRFIPVESLIRILYPNGDETWKLGDPAHIDWSSNYIPAQDPVTITLMNQLSTVATWYQPSTSGSMPVTVLPEWGYGNVFKVCVDWLNRGIKDCSDRAFTIEPDPITVIYPNGGEQMAQGSTQMIQWDPRICSGGTGQSDCLPADSTVLIKVGSGSLIPPEAQWRHVPITQKNVRWVIPYHAPLGSDYIVKIWSEANNLIYDTSDHDFSIVPAPPTSSIWVTAPNGAETWQRGTPHTITWSYAVNPGSKVKIVLLKSGVEVGTIASSVPTGIGIIGTNGGVGSYTWNIDPVGSTGSDYRVKVQSISQPAINDTSDNVFTLIPGTPSIMVSAPNGGETWQRGTSHTVTWSYTGNPGSTVKIVLLKSGVEVGTIASSVSTSIGLVGIGGRGVGSYTWKIDSVGSTGSDYQVKVSSVSHPTINDTSDNSFTLTPVPSTITVTAPNGGETWQLGTSHTVTWSYTGSPGSKVKIALLKSGVEVGIIASSVPTGIGLVGSGGGVGSYTWSINTALSTGSDYQVEVQSISQQAINDISDNSFTLTSVPSTITVTAPNGGETWQLGTSHTVTWSYTGSPGSTVKIVLLKSGIEVGTIANSALTGIGPIGSGGGIGSDTWNINPVVSTGSDYQVKVQSISQPAINDTSDNFFTLTL